MFSSPSLKLLNMLCIIIIKIMLPITATEPTISFPKIFNISFIIVLLLIFPVIAELNNSLKSMSLYTLEEYFFASSMKEEIFNVFC